MSTRGRRQHEVDFDKRSKRSAATRGLQEDKITTGGCCRKEVVVDKRSTKGRFRQEVDKKSSTARGRQKVVDKRSLSTRIRRHRLKRLKKEGRNKRVEKSVDKNSVETGGSKKGVEKVVEKRGSNVKKSVEKCQKLSGVSKVSEQCVEKRVSKSVSGKKCRKKVERVPKKCRKKEWGKEGRRSRCLFFPFLEAFLGLFLEPFFKGRCT